MKRPYVFQSEETRQAHRERTRQIGKANKGKTYSSKGSKHAEDCAHCLAIKTGANFDRLAWQKEYSKKRKFAKYGITEEEYLEMFNKQGGTCAICGGPPDTRWKMLAIDHNHETGKVRGLLCMVCNTMLGRLENRFDKVMLYLGVSYE